MAKRSGLMSDAEQEVCSRVRRFRESGRWTQEEFAAQLGISRAKLISIEYGWTPLRYDIAKRLARLNVNLKWLATGEGSMEGAIPIDALLQAKLPEKSLFSVLYKRELSPLFSGMEHYSKILSEIRQNMDRLSAGEATSEGTSFFVPRPEWVPAMRQALGLLRRYELLVRKRADLIAESIHASALHYGHSPSSKETQDERLTDITECGKSSPVQSELASLLRRANRVCKPRGKRSALADFLNVPMPRITEWLSGNREPGGETTLRLLAWVTAEEGNESGPGDVIAPPEPKTLKLTTHEKKQSGRPRRSPKKV